MPRKIDPGTLKVGTGLAAQDSVEAASVVTGTGGLLGLEAHVDDPIAAHAASAISLDDESASYDGDAVQEGLDELAALVPPRPPSLGTDKSYVTFSGVPDWGVLKLNDAGLVANSVVTCPDPLAPNSDTAIYPYFHVIPKYADGFTTPGNDPSTDLTFNVYDGTYTGGGNGDTYHGGFTRGGAVIETARIMPKPGSGNSYAVVSGSVYPADRGVLAVLYIPAGGTLADFTGQAQNLRCIAALSCGKGILTGCDGEPGGVFSLGATTTDGFDPYTFPGRATGQFNLKELHTGVSSITGGAAPPAADTSAGRSRLGFDILGATSSAAAPTLAGAADNRNDNNFFRYRLPYMSDYTAATGIRYTPTIERPRYFTKPTLALNAGTDLTQAGDYANFEKDYWTFQVARFRQRFEFPTVAGADARDIGSFVFLHFKTETAFEALVVDGTAPAGTDLYSANLVSWASAEAATNITGGATAYDPSASYHILRGAHLEDDDGDVTPTFNATTYTFTPGSPINVQVLSGVSYFRPKGQATPWKITSLPFDADDVWDSSYRVANGSPATKGLEGPNVGFLWVAPFSNNAFFTVPAGSGVAAPGRLEMNMTHLDATDGPFLMVSPPAITDKADFTIAGTGFIPAGDATNPSFSRDARVRMFIRRPMGNKAAATAVFGTGIAESNGDTILFHTTDATVYANPATATVAAAGTIMAIKDSEEKFLDEVYRYDADFPGVATAQKVILVGPGLNGAYAPIDVPVRAGTTAISGYDTSSWVQLGRHLVALPANEAQVAGLPDRNPPLTDGVAAAFPSTGMLLYPQDDFSTGIRPSGPAGDSDIAANQPDYSSETGDRVYIRAFDAGFKNSGNPVAAEGMAFFTMRIRGLVLADYAYDPAGPGSPAIAILVKIPGRTSWMDLGRVDGDGPGKQDAFSDGAGCQVVGPSTKDSVDPVTGVVFSDVLVHVGPTATLFLSAEGAVPVLVKVIIKDSASGKALSFKQGGSTGTVNNLRGLHALEIVHP